MIKKTWKNLVFYEYLKILWPFLRLLHSFSLSLHPFLLSHFWKRCHGDKESFLSSPNKETECSHSWKITHITHTPPGFVSYHTEPEMVTDKSKGQTLDKVPVLCCEESLMGTAVNCDACVEWRVSAVIVAPQAEMAFSVIG